MPDIEPTPTNALRRDRKAQAGTGLVAAAPVHSARVVGATGTRRGWLVGGCIAIAIIVAFSGAMLATSGSGGAELPTLSDAQDLRAVDHLGAPCAMPATGEAGGTVLHTDACDEAQEAGDFLEPPSDSQKSDLLPEPRASGHPHEPDDTDSAPVSPNVPTPGAPTDPGSGTPSPSNPSPGPAPAPSQPAPAPAPEPAPSDPPPVHVPKPLAFTNLTENRGLLGLILSSYTLSITGEPGATATVSYGSHAAGSVTFNANGSASITLGTSLIDLGLSNPIIRASYSDGTSGSDIQARRDSI